MTLLAYLGKEGCRSVICSRRSVQDSCCYGWHCGTCDEPASSQGHNCPQREAPGVSDAGFESGMADGLSFSDARRVAHDRWVASGHCAEINWAKTWCNGEAGHYGDHWAPYENPDGGVTYVEWG